MVPERAASMLNGRDGLDWLKEGGSTRRKGDDEARRCFEIALMRLFLGDPRDLLIGVDFVLDGVRIFRVDITDGVALSETLLDETRLNLEGFTKSKSRVELVLDFLVGEAKIEGSMFSESASSKISGARWRLPVDCMGDGFMGESKLEVMAVKTRLEQYMIDFEVLAITILLVLCALEQLKTRTAKLAEGLARN
jgi:hypothetical protein